MPNATATVAGAVVAAVVAAAVRSSIIAVAREMARLPALWGHVSIYPWLGVLESGLTCLVTIPGATATSGTTTRVLRAVTGDVAFSVAVVAFLIAHADGATVTG